MILLIICLLECRKVAGYTSLCGRRGGLTVSALDSGANGPGSNPGLVHWVTLTVYKRVSANLLLGGNPLKGE